MISSKSDKTSSLVYTIIAWSLDGLNLRCDSLFLADGLE
jgi:hypothetical protein